jgi:membrane fusion protein
VLVSPLSFAVLSAIFAALALATCAFLAFGSYTKRNTVTGQLVSDAGVAQVFVPQAGIVLERYVNEGQFVKPGDTLFVVSSERSSASEGETQAAISVKVRERQASLASEIGKTRLLQRNERPNLESKISGMRAELHTLDMQILDQREQVRLVEESVSRYQALKDKGMASAEQLREKTAELIDQRARLLGFERDRIVLNQDLAVQAADLASLSLKQQNQLLQIDRALNSTSQELVESEAKRRLKVLAPTAGTATAILVNVGQAVDDSKPLASIVPASGKLHAELYAPSRAVGFVRVGDPVLIRYQSFPYQKFGQQRGTVQSVARTALPTSELTAVGAWSYGRSDEPLYRITVELKSQTVPAYGQAQSLQSGMLLEADVMQEKRRLYEWVLEPLYSLSGKL